MDPNEARRRIQQVMSQGGQIGSPPEEGVKYGIPGDVRAIYSVPLEPNFLVDGSGGTLELLALLISGNRSNGARLAGLNQGISSSGQLPAGTSVVLPSDMQAPSWQDQYTLDPFNRTNLNYWTARALEATFNVPGSVLGVMAVQVCVLGKTGEPGQCCDPTSDPFPSKPYLYKVPAPRPNGPVMTPQDVARDFGRDENGWIELRRANADDPSGFVKQENKWCWWRNWGPGKILRIPGSWSESEFSPAVAAHLVDGNGQKFQMSDLAGHAQLFLKGMPWRWRTPIHMLIECGQQVWSNPAMVPGPEADLLIGKEIIKRSFLITDARPGQVGNAPEAAAPAGVSVLDGSTLEHFIAKNPNAVIRFHAQWCGHCKKFGPVFKSVAESTSGFAFGDLDVDQNKASSQKYSINGLPTTILFRGGKVSKRIEGEMQAQRLKDWLG